MTDEPGFRTTDAHLRRAIAGDDPSLAWLVERFTPLLLAQAQQRIGPSLRRSIDAPDLVQDVWVIALPKLATLGERAPLSTGVLVAFLARILLYRSNDLVRKHIVGKPQMTRSSDSALARLPQNHSGIVTRAVRSEQQGAVHAAICELDDDDRRVVISRGLEQNSVRDIAADMGWPENRVSVRYRRALAKLRQRLPGDVFDELPED